MKHNHRRYELEAETFDYSDIEVGDYITNKSSYWSRNGLDGRVDVDVIWVITKKEPGKAWFSRVWMLNKNMSYVLAGDLIYTTLPKTKVKITDPRVIAFVI